MKNRIAIFLLSCFVTFGVNAQWQESFENIKTLPKAWTSKGEVGIDKENSFKGKQSLILEKTENTLHSEVSITSVAFPISTGEWTVEFAAKTELQSMDNSYNGSLKIEFLDSRNHKIGETGLITLFRINNWKPTKKDIEIPENTTSARFVAAINKETLGQFWIDELVINPSQNEKKNENIKRMMFTTAQLGNLIYPHDSKEITVEVWSVNPLLEKERNLSIVVTDCWGAEQNKPIEATLKNNGKEGNLFSFLTKVDLSTIPLETGRYYQIHGAIERENDIPFTNYTSFAILPEAAANSYKAEDIPWTSRNWDNRITEYVHLTHRLGVRICGIWGHMDSDPNKVDAPQLDLIEKLGMGYLTGTPAHGIEQRHGDWEDLLVNDGEKLRQGVRNFIAKYGHVRPVIINLGNEPHAKGEEVKINVEAYRIVYQEIKKIDPTIYVVGTSIGTNDDFAKYGFGEWCDAYDFHVYEDAISVREIVSERYPTMFAKYGHAKPVWSTELGLNSQGMDRRFVAAELFRKTVNFFAGGGANMSWFGLLYPDPEGKDHDSFGSAHNVFDCRYNKYAPKLDAIAYYNAVNSILSKKYVEDKTYADDIHAFLFRDTEGRALQVWYKDKGQQDVFIPMTGVGEVNTIQIDGSRSTLQAGEKGITLTITEDPILLLYENGEKVLPAGLEKAKIELGKRPESIVLGNNNELDIVLNQVPENNVIIKLPPFWTEQHSIATDKNGNKVLRYTLDSPNTSTIREANIVIQTKDQHGNINGELFFRPSIKGTLSLQVLPMPANKNQDAAVKLLLQNNSSNKQSLNWNVTLQGEQELKEGVFTAVTNSSAYFTETSSGTFELAGNKSKEIILPLANVDLYKVYRLHASVQDDMGRAIVEERPVSAFYGVPKAKNTISIDGILDEIEWKNAPVRYLNHVDQFYAFKRSEFPTVQDWTGADDLSAEIRYLWDNNYFYVSVKVKDEIAGKILHADADLWQQDGLQFLIDPMRTSKYKVGKYEYTVGEGTKGVQTWCTLSADGAAPTGNVSEIQVAIQHGQKGTGDITYEIAFPWSRLAPFKPNVGENLGFTLIVNEDDGNGRDAFMTWFGNAHTKDIDTVGDLILVE